MTTIRQQRFDEERALYSVRDISIKDCVFDGPADGESALKECRNVVVEDCRFCLRYPFWHDKKLRIERSDMTESCRAAIWYCDSVEIRNSNLHGIKAVRECSDVRIEGCDIVSAEFGWFIRGMTMEQCSAESEYFMMRSNHLGFRDVRFKGKYSFQYITDSVFERCTFDTKDAFWHGKNILVRDSIVQGEYLAWYSENVTFERCKIVGTQPFCYCKGLRLVDCEMIDTDLAFERSEVEANLLAPIVSIKNPLSGRIRVPAVGEIIRDIDGAEGEIITDA